MVQQIEQFKFQGLIFQVSMQLCTEYSRITNQTWHKLFKHFSDEFQLCTAYLVFKQSVPNVHQLQQQTFNVCFKVIALP